ncbi:MAG: alpha/beta hydrolase [Hyphomonadaceae bacterium]|nr:alpha/beta hydrolase [Hyphomonadaceae bacterium]MBC6412203.1 alpha/beta hydrolase [Hyphomonadaceae bacterium]
MIKRIIPVVAVCVGLLACQGAESPVEDISAGVAASPYLTGADHYVDVDGLSMRYRDEGPEDAPILLMVHGFTFSLETWDAVADRLTPGYRIIRPDLPGHGLTGPDIQDRYTNEDTVAFLSGFINALGLSDPVIVGNSLGGLVAWRYAASHPDRVRGLILISPGGFSINGVTEEPVPVPKMVELYLTQAPEAGVSAATGNMYADPQKLAEERLTQIRDMMLQPGNGDAFVKRAGMFTLPPPETDLAGVGVPTLIIWGDRDKIIPPDHGSGFVEAMPQAILKLYENAGHLPQEETPDRLAEDIHLFTGGLASPE